MHVLNRGRSVLARAALVPTLVLALAAPSSAALAADASGVQAAFTGPGHWFRADNQTTGADVINTAAVPHTITHYSMQMDSANRPHVVWSTNLFEIFYSHWTGSTWTGLESVNPDGNNATFEADNISGNLGVSIEPSLTLHQDRPYVAWTDTITVDSEIHFRYWNGSAWTGLLGAGTDVVSSGVLVSLSPTIAVNAFGTPSIAWAEDSGVNAEISYVQWTGSAWEGLLGASPDNVSGNATQSVFPSLALDPNGTPYLAWQDAPGGVSDIFFARWTGSAWSGYTGVTPDNISANTGVSLLPSIAVAAVDRPAIAWADDTIGNSEVLVGRWSGSAWRGFAGVGFDDVSVTGTASVSPSLKLKSNGNPAVSWAEVIATNLSEIRYTNWNGTTYTGPSDSDADSNPVTFDSVLVANAGAQPQTSLDVDTFDNPGVYWNDDASGSVVPISRVLFTHWISDALLDVINDGASLERIAGPDRIDTSIEISKKFFPTTGSADNVILARSDLPVDALVTAPFASLLKAPILLNPTAKLDSRVSAEIARVLKTGGTVFLMGQTKALATQVETDLQTAGFTKRDRVGGARRQETSVEVAKRVDTLQGKDSTYVFLANGQTAVDALVAGSAAVLPDASGLRKPIVLATVNDLPKAVSDYISGSDAVATINVLGGTAVISDEIVGQASSLRSGMTVLRTAGADRYATARLVGEKFFPDAVTAFITVGTRPTGIPPDAVVIAPHAGPLNGAILLVKTNDLTNDARTYLTEHKDTLNAIKVIGGTAAVSDAVANQALSLI